MTIGIGMSGPRAGEAVIGALAAVERVGRGAIGGFVSMAVITSGGLVIRAETQRGGSKALPADILVTMNDAPIAGLISSGPDRPEPLSRFIAVDPHAGLVTGHRFPFVEGVNGEALNQCVLARLAAGDSAAAAVAGVAYRNPESDAGLIAVDLHGGVAGRDTRFVSRRRDGGAAHRRGSNGQALVAVLHNSIFPAAPLAELAAWTALDVSDPEDRVDHSLHVHRGTEVVLARRNAIHANSDGTVRRIDTKRRLLLAAGVVEGSPIMMGTPVMCEGAIIGTNMSEPYCVVEGGRLQSFDGGDHFTLRFRSR